MNEEVLALDRKAKSLAENYLQTEGEILTVLMELKKRNGFAILNYAGLFDYCEKGFGYRGSKRTTTTRWRSGLSRCPR